MLAVIGGVWVVLGEPEEQLQPESSAASSSLTSEASSTTTAPTTTSVVPPPPAPLPPPPPSPPPIEELARELCSTVLKGAQPHVAQAGHLMKGLFGISDVGGASGRGGNDDHTSGLALDFMVDDVGLGTELADFALNNQSKFGISYVIWQQQYNAGSGWSYMEDRGSPTANHYDHVHVSFTQSGPLDLVC
ncbi:hypothetical protein [Rhodococcus sp. NPDC058481]|uniref:hypothetical protein n=1 Tax=unclassified Rhodococcus (in: high G+C Gram-positive bacteria) TaxID=192944 RepID=UPI0036515382